VKAGQLLDPPGYCHHSMSCDERYFRQQTAEYLKTGTVRGRSTRFGRKPGRTICSTRASTQWRWPNISA
jgi:hypothetical protein